MTVMHPLVEKTVAVEAPAKASLLPFLIDFDVGIDQNYCTNHLIQENYAAEDSQQFGPF